MPDEVLVFEHRHDVEGSVRFVKKQALVHVSCRWPFDRDADEWIFIANDLTVDDYVDCLAKLVAEGVGRAVGVDHGFIEFTTLGPGKTQLEISDHAPTRRLVFR